MTPALPICDTSSSARRGSNPSAVPVLLLLAVLLAGGSAFAEDRHMVVEGLLKDDAGAVLEGSFQVTVSLYAAQDSVDSEWTETLDAVTVSKGFFQARLGLTTVLENSLFEQNPGLWIGIMLEGQEEFPRTTLETDPYAYRSMSAATADALQCSGCIDQSHVGFNVAGADATGAALTAVNALSADVANAINCTGCIDLTALGVDVLAAGNVSFDDTVAELGATDVQSALEKLKAALDAGGGGNGNVNEGAGSVSRYSNQWGLPSYGTAVEYIHLLNPSPAKVLLHLYAGEATGFAGSNNLIVQSGAYAPNAYSGGVNGDAGSDTVNVTNAGEFNIGDHVLIHQTVGNTPGHWELNAVKAVTGTAVTLAKPLEQTYKSASGSTQERAQMVIAASYNQLEIVSGGVIRPSTGLGGNDDNNMRGGIVYLRAQTITVKNGGKIEANGEHGTGGYGGFWGGDTASNTSERGQSECSIQNNVKSHAAYCSGGGGGYYYSSCTYSQNRAGAGGGNQTAGQDGKGSGSGSTSKGGGTKGSADAATLEFGGGGGYGANAYGGVGGGIVVIGAKTIIVETGGIISANGGNGQGQANCRAGAGGGGGGSVVIFAKTVDNQGTIEAKGGTGGTGYSGRIGGDGGEGWVIEKQPIPGVVNQSYATGVEIWVDGQEVTAAVADPNGKGEPHWNSTDKKWGATGTDPWSSGPLDLTNVANWTLGEHKLEFKETGGAGGDLKAYTYVIHPFTESVPPANDSCTSPSLIDPNTEAVVLSGTTEDMMGKTKASDNNQGTCGGGDGTDVVYKIELAQRSLINVDLVAPFPATLYIRKDACNGGDEVYCKAANSISSTPLEPGDYFLFVDADTAQAKGNFKLTVSTTPAPLPANDTCATAIDVTFGADGIATHSGTNQYGLDQYQGNCVAGANGGADVVYKFTAGMGQTLNVTVDADFDALLYLTNGQCGDDGNKLTCQGAGNLSLSGLGGGTYWLYVDGADEKEWGEYNLTISLQTPGQ